MNGTVSARASPQPILNRSASMASLSGSAMTPSASTNVSQTGSATTTPSKPQRPARRIETEALMNEFRKILGDKWAHYREVLTSFLIGRLTRIELESELATILNRNTVRMHNQFLLASMANSLRDPPPSANGLPGWSTRPKDSLLRSSKNAANPVIARLKSEIMGFTPRERRRIKAITSEAGKTTPPLSTIVLTRQAKLPVMPSGKDKDKVKSSKLTSHLYLALSVCHLTILAITQDIIQNYHLPLSSESFELPDADSLRTRVLGIAYEHGLMDGISGDVPQIILAGLEYHMRGFVQQLFDRVRPKHRIQSALTAARSFQSNTTFNSLDAPSSRSQSDAKRKLQEFDDDNVITAEDMALALDLVPHSIIQPSGPLYRLYDVMLRDEMDD
ncbi:transcriptional regulator of RNA polII, SAGA, subunit-domain-containing protein [Lipomyces oligophaga]|uniref:transcriptional regulator of RNA polII, SAGA, subunit-domain-containing protein n=1 Tax=Lipomyces oligophaga TaxID=45792 RepID=UPI0034CEFB54